MGMEALNSAARAAGFAMAAPDDLLQEGAASMKRRPEPARSVDAVVLRPLESTPDATLAHRATEWLRNLFGASGRRAPA
jgi:hypothetical protein